jgi:glycosyltransferase involved in cell wall biosynthesis
MLAIDGGQSRLRFPVVVEQRRYDSTSPGSPDEMEDGVATEVTGDETPGRRPHLLYVAWGFPPSRGGGVHRALATVNAFAHDGWDVTVLTAPREVFRELTGDDESLESLVDPRVHVVRVPFSWPAKQTDVRTFSLLRVLFPRLWSKARSRFDVLGFPEQGYGPWRRRVERAALETHARHPVDLVMATTNPQVSIAPALRLSEHAVPVVIDYRDAWTLDTYAGVRRHSPDSPEGRWEARAFASATEIWFVNQPLRSWHAETYPQDAQRMYVVMNGYDSDLPLPPAARPNGTPMRFGYIGTITPVMPLPELVAGWRHARENEASLASAKLSLRGYLGYYGTPDPTLAGIVEAAADAGVEYGGPIPKTCVADVYAAFDVLVLVLGGGEFVTSGKVFEYVSSGLPVVSVLTPGNGAADILRDYPRWHPAAALTPTEIACALAAGADDARLGTGEQVVAAQEAARPYRRDRQLAPRIEALRALVSEGSQRLGHHGGRS